MFDTYEMDVFDGRFFLFSLLSLSLTLHLRVFDI